MKDQSPAQTADLLKALLSIPRALGPNLEVLPAFEATAGTILTVSGITALLVKIMDQNNGQLFNVLSRGPDSESLIELCGDESGSELCGQVAAGADAVHLEELDPGEWASNSLNKNGLKALSIVPIASTAGVMGILAAAGPAGVLNKDLAAFLEAAGAQLGVALENIGLLSEVVASSQEWEATFDSLEDLIAICDSEGRLIRINTALAASLGLERERLGSLRLQDLAGGALCGQKNDAHLIKDVVRSREPQTAEVKSPDLGGRFLVTASPLGENSIVVIARNVGLLYDLEKARARAARLEEVNRFKGAFLGQVSHEFRTPLHGILSTAEMLTDGLYEPLNTEQTEAMGDILASGQRLLVLVNNLLDLTNLDAGRLELTLASFPLAGVVENVIELFRNRAAGRRIELAGTGLENCHTIKADKKRFQNILASLVGRAIDQTPYGGRVEINISCPAGRAEISITESGDPADEEEHSLAFHLARRLIELHGGSLKTDPGQNGSGAILIISLPQE